MTTFCFSRLCLLLLTSSFQVHDATVAFAFSLQTPYQHRRPPQQKQQQQRTPATTTTTASWRVSRLSVINSLEDAELNFDEGMGGVRLAKESALKLSGTVQHKPGSATAKLSDFKRYRSVSHVDSKIVDKLTKHSDSKVCSILSVGHGQELYKSPGSTTQKEVFLAPIEAIKDALLASPSAMSMDTLVFNFLGGPDMQLKEVMDASQQLTLMLDIKTKAKVIFHALSHQQFEERTVSVTVVGWSTEEGQANSADLFGVERAVASGEIYEAKDGKYYTVIETDINTDVE